MTKTTYEQLSENKYRVTIVTSGDDFMIPVVGAPFKINDIYYVVVKVEDVAPLIYDVTVIVP